MEMVSTMGAQIKIIISLHIFLEWSPLGYLVINDILEKSSDRPSHGEWFVW